MCRDNREHNYKELERRNAIKETVDDFMYIPFNIILFGV